MKLDIEKVRELKTEASLLRMWKTGISPSKGIGLTSSINDRGELIVKPDSRGKNKILAVKAYEDRRSNVSFSMCRSGSEAIFAVPNFGAPKNCWVVFAYDVNKDQFLNAMSIGTFNECLNLLLDFDLEGMQKSYTKHLLAQGSKVLVSSRQKLLDDMASELADAEREYEQTVASIRGAYRTRLTELTAMLDKAQADADKKDKAVYLFELYGYPESKTYGSFKEVRRAHSRRHVPETPCVIYRMTGKKKIKFAKWSLADRIWTLI